MRFDSMRIAAVLGVTILGVAFAVAPPSHAQAQGADAKATDQHPGGGDSSKEGAKKAPKPDQYAESEKLLGPAGSPECMWLGQRVVKLLQSDDLDTAFRHLDLYDRFGCPSGHIQIAFRCFVRQQASIDPKALDAINGRIQDCWLHPNTDPVITPPAAASAAPPSQAQ